MDCPTEERLIRDKLEGMAGVEALSFNLIQRELTVAHRLPSIAPLVAVLKSLDMDPAVRSDSQSSPSSVDGERNEVAGEYSIPRRRWMLLAVSGVAAIGAEIVAWTTGQEQSWPVIALAMFAILTGGIDTLKKGWIALRNLSLNMNFLMSLAVIGAIVIGQWPEAAVVIFLFALAEMIESLSLDRARNAIKGLMAMAPELATVQASDGTWQELAAKDVVINTVVRVKPGERIPLDGTIVSGQTTINQAPITGESIPVAKEPGDAVFAGTINERGGFDYRVTSDQGHSTLSRIIKTRAGSARPAGTDAALRRSVCAVLHPRSRRLRCAGRHRPAAAHGRAVPALVLQGVGASGHRLSMRIGDFDTGHHRKWARRGRQARHPDQGRLVSGTGAPTPGARTRQDRHDHNRATGVDRPHGGSRDGLGDAAAPRRKPRRALGSSGVVRGFRCLAVTVSERTTSSRSRTLNP